MLNQLPQIVTKAGIYRTRDGRRVNVHFDPVPNPDPTITAFTVKGSIERMYRGKPIWRGYHIWHVSGRALPLKETGRDIVAKES